MFRKLLLIHTSFMVLSLGIFYFQVQGPNLIWHMIMSLIALDLAAAARFIKKADLRILFIPLWLIFFPNTFYMLTDLVHLDLVSTVLWDSQTLVLFMLFIPSILLGVFSGVLSVRYAFDSMGLKNPYIRLLLAALLAFVASVSSYLGQYARLNFWDLFLKPMVVLQQLQVLFNHEALPFVLGFALIQFMALLFMESDD